MVIGIDVRSLMDEKLTGIGEYTLNLLKALFRIDTKNEYRLFYNSFQSKKCHLKEKYPNVQFYRFKYPNKIFNFGLNFFSLPKIDKLLGGVDLFFMPNWQFMALSRRSKKIITVHDLSFEYYPQYYSLKRRLWHKFIKPKRLIQSSDKIITPSESTKRDLIKLYKIQPEKIEVIYSGIGEEFKFQISNFKFQKVKEKYNLPDNFILYLGTLEPRKNLENLILAFDELYTNLDIKEHKLKCKYYLVIAGAKGWLYESIYKTARSIKAKDHVKFIDYVAPEDKPYLYNLASLFVYPSFYEGFGFPPLEAMACGVPTVVSFSSSLLEVVGKAALAINPYDIREVAQSMFECLTDDRLRDSLKNKGPKQAKRFSWQKCDEKTLEVFDEVKNARAITKKRL